MNEKIPRNRFKIIINYFILVLNIFLCRIVLIIFVLVFWSLAILDTLLEKGEKTFILIPNRLTFSEMTLW